MKILYVDVSLQGHREVYLRAFEQNSGAKQVCFYLFPQEAAGIRMKFIPMKSGFDKERNMKTYLGLLKEVKKAVKENGIDVVHFLNGDSLYRFFGIGLGTLKAKVVITYHHMVFSKVKLLAIKNMFRHSICGVVHTEYLLRRLLGIGIRNAECIYYPMLDAISDRTTEEAKLYFGIKGDGVVLGVIGGTQDYKGLDILLGGLNRVKYPCMLFVAGVERTFSKEYIEKTITNRLVERCLVLRGLSDEEFADAVQASDIIMLPYRKAFDGASGPLVSAAVHNKPVIAANHGSLGDIVSRYALGECFESENEESLAKVLNEHLGHMERLTTRPEAFCAQLTVEAFQNAYTEIYSRYKRNKD